MPEIVGIRFKRACKIYSFDPAGLNLKEGDEVIVETARGHGFGEVVKSPHEVEEEDLVSPLRSVARRATEEDKKQMKANEEAANRALAICESKINKHGLPMRLVDAEYAFDGSQLIFYFTADGRVDFRELVRDLASTFHTRIELRQIGVRDEAKLIGGLGPCGRDCCCTTFLSDFAPISIRMAKRQNLALNPAKISGLCGRLMCCLRFEDEAYKEAQAKLPRPGTPVVTPEGEGRVTQIHKLEVSVDVRLSNDRVERFGPDEFRRLKSKKGGKR